MSARRRPSSRYRPGREKPEVRTIQEWCHNVDLRRRIVALAQRPKRYGVGMIHLKLRQAGEPVNYKHVERLCQEAKLQVRRRKWKKVPVVE
jgi:hypothetical protein